MSNGNDLWDENRRRVLKAMAAAAAATSLPGTLWAGQCPPVERYNVLWLMADEHNPFVAGYAGDPRVKTKNLDLLAGRSTIFTNAYTTNPICVPARQAIQTGRMSSNINWADLINKLPPNFKGLGPYFKGKNYRTAWFGKQHWDHTEQLEPEVPDPDTLLVDPHVQYETMKTLQSAAKKAYEDATGETYPNSTVLNREIQSAKVSEDIDEDWSENLNEDSLCTDEAIKYLNKLDDNPADTRPFFMGVSWVKPHFPFVIQKDYYNKYSAPFPPRPTVLPEMFGNLSTAMKRDWDKYEMWARSSTDFDNARAIYYGMITYIDKQVGRVLKKLTDLGLREKTIVIYVSDHGEMLGQHGIWYKNAFLEASARVPMLISLPGVHTSQTIDAPVSLLDLYPTLCDLLCLPEPSMPGGGKYLEGKSLVPLIDGSETGSDRVVFSENKRFGIVARMMRTNSWKYCYYDYDPDSDQGYTTKAGTFHEPMREQLYDMQGADRNIESVNLAKDPSYATLKADLRTLANAAPWNPGGLIEGDVDEA